MAHSLQSIQLSQDLDDLYASQGGSLSAKSIATISNKNLLSPKEINMKDSAVFGNGNQIISSDSLPVGYTTGQMIVGLNNKVYGSNINSQIFGQGNEMSGNCANTMITGVQNTVSRSQDSFTAGRYNEIKGFDPEGYQYGSNFAIGYNNRILLNGKGEENGKCAVLMGAKSKTEYGYTFVWNSQYGKEYSSNGCGTFNVNTKNGLSGVYFGKDNFIQCVLSAVQMMNDEQKEALKTALGL